MNKKQTHCITYQLTRVVVSQKLKNTGSQTYLSCSAKPGYATTIPVGSVFSSLKYWQWNKFLWIIINFINSITGNIQHKLISPTFIHMMYISQHIYAAKSLYKTQTHLRIHPHTHTHTLKAPFCACSFARFLTVLACNETASGHKIS